MPRRSYKKHKINSDKLYESLEVAKLINYIMKDGKKTIAEKVVYEVLDKIKKEGLNPLQIINQAIKNAAPNFEVRPRRLGGASYLVPREVSQKRKLFLALNWIINAAQKRPNKQYHTFSEKLYHEIIDASKNQGEAVNKRLQTEKLAEANKAFAHLRW